MEILIDFVRAYAADYWDHALGITLWLASLVIPFRQIAANNPIRWDIVGAITGVGFAYVADYLVDLPTDYILRLSVLDPWHALVAQMHPLTVAGCFLVLSDFLVYWAHRSMHTRHLWQVHAWHHSAEKVHFIAGLRGSLPDTLILFTPFALAYLVFPLGGTGMFLITFLIIASINPFIHSNLRVPFPRLIEKVFVTPRFHFVHHSASIAYGNSNYGKLFTVWDRLFGTFTDPDTVPSDQPLGLGYPANNWKMLLGLKTGEPEQAGEPSVIRATG